MGKEERWQTDKIETTASVLHALVLIKPESPFVKKAVDFLMHKRKGGRWNSTSDTAAAVRAFSAYLEKTGANKKPMDATVTLNGVERKINPPAGKPHAGMLACEFEGKDLRAGKNTLEVKREGGGQFYFSAFCTYVTTEEMVKPSSAGGLKISRRMNLEMDEQGVLEGRIGDFVTVELTIKSTRARQYVMITDFLPACAQALLEREQKDHLKTSERGKYDHWERHAEKTVFFITNLPEGETKIRYVFRVTHSGLFHTMPAEAELMYFPDVRATSAEVLLHTR